MSLIEQSEWQNRKQGEQIFQETSGNGRYGEVIGKDTKLFFFVCFF